MLPRRIAADRFAGWLLFGWGLLWRGRQGSAKTFPVIILKAAVLKQFNWKQLPKHHAVTHYYDLPLNPRKSACNQDEEMLE